MKKFVFRLVALLVSLLYLPLTAGCFGNLEVKKIEEIIGTYLLQEYYYAENGVRTDIAGEFRSFYLIIYPVSSARTVLFTDEETSVTTDFPYLLHYAPWGADLVDELTLRFSMPDRTNESGIELNYLTVTSSDTLFCKKITYGDPLPGGAISIQRVTYITFKRVSSGTVTPPRYDFLHL